VLKAYKYRIYPNKEQTVQIAKAENTDSKNIRLLPFCLQPDFGIPERNLWEREKIYK